MFPVCRLAREVTKWTVACDKSLLRLICYMNSTQELVQVGFVGDDIKNCTICIYSDADYAGDKITSCSTSAGFIAICGPNTMVPVATLCKKQRGTSSSTTESEIVALYHVMKTDGAPLMDLWEVIAEIFVPLSGGRRSSLVAKKSSETRQLTPSVDSDSDNSESMSLQSQIEHSDSECEQPLRARASILPPFVLEDNDATIKIIKKGRSLQLRHVNRTQRVPLSWLFDFSLPKI